jgi:signal transduction histidine kinase
MTMEADRLFEDPTDYAGLMAEVDRGSARAERDIALWRRSGKPLWVRVFVRRLDDPARTVFEWSVVDITRQRQAEARAAALQAELDRRQGNQGALLQEIEGFAYAVAYDLRSPLRRMDELSQTLLASYGLKLDAAGRDSLTRLAASSVLFHPGRGAVAPRSIRMMRQVISRSGKPRNQGAHLRV